jgi:hypothetical protein
VRLHHHLASDHSAAAQAAGLAVVGFEEPRLTEEAVVTPTSELLPDATRRAYLGLPGVLIWEFERP